MAYKYYHISNPKDYYIRIDSSISVEKVKSLLRCNKIIEVSLDEYRKITMPPNFYQIEQSGNELVEATYLMINEIIKEIKELTPEQAEMFRAQIAQCGCTAEELKQAMQKFVRPTEEDILMAGLNPSAIFQDEYKK